MALADNAPMLGMLRRHAPGLSLAPDGEHLAIEAPLPARLGWRSGILAAWAAFGASRAPAPHRTFAGARA